MKVITSDRLTIFNSYGGDIDTFARLGKAKEKMIFGGQTSEIWLTIDQCVQYVELLSKKLVSKGYATQAIQSLQDLCDKDSFEQLTAGVSLSNQ